MYKISVLLLILSLIAPLAFTSGFDENQVLQTSDNQGPIKTIPKIEQGEEILDFWDFKIQDHELVKEITKTKKKSAAHETGDREEQKKLAMLKKGNKAFGSKAERNKINEIDQLIKEVNSMINKIENPNSPDNLKVEEEAKKVRGIILQDESVEEEEEEEEEEDETPIPPTEVATVKVQASIKFDLNINTFNDQGGQDLFVNFIAKLASVPKNRIRIISVIAGSVIIVFEVIMPASAPNAAEQLTEVSTKIKEAAGKNELVFMEGASVLEHSVIVTEDFKSERKDKSVGVALGVSLGLLFLIGIAVLVFSYQRRKARREERERPYRAPGNDASRTLRVDF